MIKVLKTGFYSSIQDLGRYGHRGFGVPVSGAMDSYSSRFANQLLGNNENAAVLEITMTGPKLQFLNATTIVLTGANMHPKLNESPIAMFKSILVNPNDILSFGSLTNGFRTYLAVNGGFKMETVLGSKSMANGITDKVRIEKGDVLDCCNPSSVIKLKHAKLKFNASNFNVDTLDVLKGPEFNQLTKTQKNSLINQEFEVSKFNNRMAYQILPLLENSLKPILTSPVLPGTVQLTPSGQLIILMRDCQTTGGYPRVFQLTENAINLLSQKYTGSSLKFSLNE